MNSGSVICTQHNYKSAVSPYAGKGVIRRGPPLFYYACSVCGKTKYSVVNINACIHDFVNDPDFGESFMNYRACKKCGKQENE